MYVTVNNRAAYAYTGAKPLAPDRGSIVFIHGSGLDHTVWLLQSRYFAHHGWNVLAVDLPGHGRSEGPPLTAIEEIADWIGALLEALAVPRAVLVGHSMGALVALETAARYPKRTERVALLGASMPLAVSEPLLNAARNNERGAIDMITLWGHGHSTQFGGNPVPGMWLIGGTVRLLEQARPGVLYNDLNACNQYQAGLASAQQVRCRALMVMADQDRMTPPANAEELIHSLGNLRTVTLTDCGHLMLAEQPDQVLDALKDFVASPA